MPSTAYQDTSFWKIDIGIVLVVVISNIMMMLRISNKDRRDIGLALRTFAVFLPTYSLVVAPSSYALRWYLLRKWICVTEDDYRSIMGGRSTFDLEALLQRYGKGKFKIYDCLTRKLFHFLNYALYVLVFLPVVAEKRSDATTLSFIWASFILSVLQLSSVGYFTCGPRAEASFASTIIDQIITPFIHVGVRVRDGKQAYINLRVANITSGTAALVANYVVDWLTTCGPGNTDSGDTLVSMTWLMFLPVLLGDAMGEIIGAPFGRHTFNVKGFGDINKKSVEGCAAVFFSSLVSTLSSAFVAWPDELPSVGWKVGLPLMVSALTVLTETYSFRSTDNFVIPVCNCFLVAGVYRNIHVEC